jgi:hypothetical protein
MHLNQKLLTIFPFKINKLLPDHYRNDYGVQISSKADIKGMVEILSSMLEDAEIKEEIQ